MLRKCVRTLYTDVRSDVEPRPFSRTGEPSHDVYSTAFRTCPWLNSCEPRRPWPDPAVPGGADVRADAALADPGDGQHELSGCRHASRRPIDLGRRRQLRRAVRAGAPRSGARVRAAPGGVARDRRGGRASGVRLGDFEVPRRLGRVAARVGFIAGAVLSAGRLRPRLARRLAGPAVVWGRVDVVAGRSGQRSVVCGVRRCAGGAGLRHQPRCHCVRRGDAQQQTEEVDADRLAGCGGDGRRPRLTGDGSAPDAHQRWTGRSHDHAAGAGLSVLRPVLSAGPGSGCDDSRPGANVVAGPDRGSGDSPDPAAHRDG